MPKKKGEGIGCGGRSRTDTDKEEAAAAAAAAAMGVRPTPTTVTEVADVFRRPASPREVSRAVATIEEAFGETHSKSSQPKSLIRELNSIWFSPDFKGLIFSLMMDPAVWKAIGDNPTVREAIRCFSNTGKGGKSIDNMGGESLSRNHVLHWVRETLDGLINVTQDIMEILQSLRKFLMTPKADNPSSSEQNKRKGTTTTMPVVLQRLITLSVIILYGAIVVLRLLSFSI